MTPQEYNDQCARVDDQVGRDGCAPSIAPLIVIAALSVAALLLWVLT